MHGFDTQLPLLAVAAIVVEHTHTHTHTHKQKQLLAEGVGFIPLLGFFWSSACSLQFLCRFNTEKA